MYVFLVLGMPLGFLLLFYQVYPKEESIATKRAFLRGLVSFIPIGLVAFLLGAAVPALPGSAWSALHEWAWRILPYSFLPAAAYPVFYRYDEPQPAGATGRRLTAFYAGTLSPAGIAEMVRMWGNPDTYVILLLPILFAAMVLLMPRVALGIRDSFGFRLFSLIAGSVAASLGLSFLPFLFLLRLWPLAWLAAIAALWLGWIISAHDLARRPPPLTE